MLVSDNPAIPVSDIEIGPHRHTAWCAINAGPFHGSFPRQQIPGPPYFHPQPSACAPPRLRGNRPDRRHMLLSQSLQQLHQRRRILAPHQ